MGAPSRTFSALQQKPYGPNLVILIFCRIPIGELVPGYEHSPTRFSHGQTIFQNELQEDQEVGPDGKVAENCLVRRVCWYVRYRTMFTVSTAEVESRQFRKCGLPVVWTTKSVS